MFGREEDGHIKVVYATIGKLILTKAIIIVAAYAVSGSRGCQSCSGIAMFVPHSAMHSHFHIVHSFSEEWLSS